jgi:chloramphenicol-sensitive protein RarD
MRNVGLTRSVHGATTRAGVAYALAAYGSWGLIPIYWKTLKGVPAMQVVAHRGVWALLVLLVVLGLRRRLGEVARALRSGRQVAWLAASGLLLATNWLVFIWAIHTGRVLESSLGYYVTPLVMVLLGRVFLRERLRPAQGLAVAFATAAVVALAALTGTAPWVALALAFTFGLYGLLRKVAHADALVGLSVETALMAPLALAYLLHLEAAGRSAFVHEGAAVSVLLALTGPMTAFPLLWFAHAARRLRYATLGQFQYITPTGHFLLATLLYGEPLTNGHLVAFPLIAVALALYSWDSARAARQPPAVPPAGTLGSPPPVPPVPPE